TTRTSVGPASRSMPTRPKSCRLASATYALPAPTSMSTGGRSSSTRPKANAASAWTPPRAATPSAPDVHMAYNIAGWMPPPRRRCAIEVLLRHQEARRIPPIQVARPSAHGVHPAGLDVRQHRLHPAADLEVGVPSRGGRGLQVIDVLSGRHSCSIRMQLYACQ